MNGKTKVTVIRNSDQHVISNSEDFSNCIDTGKKCHIIEKDSEFFFTAINPSEINPFVDQASQIFDFNVMLKKEDYKNDPKYIELDSFLNDPETSMISILACLDDFRKILQNTIVNKIKLLMDQKGYELKLDD